jgi:multicomponent Na+:H+ antiporter subunit D
MNTLVVFVALPLFAAFFMPILGKIFRRGIDGLAVLVTAVLALSSLALAWHPPAMPYIYAIGSWQPPFGIAWLVDPLTIFMLLVINGIAFFVTIYSVDYMRKFTSKAKYYSLLMLMIVGLNGIIISGDVFNMFVFLEITAIASYALVAFGTEAEEVEAAFKYMVLGSIASGFILLGIAFLYAKTSTLNMFDMARVFAQTDAFNFKIYIATLFIVGFGIKAALVPFHPWLPDAHPSAPAPISAMLSGLVIKGLGVYVLMRFLYNIMGMNSVISEILMILGGLSMIVGVILAIGQWDFKRLLAYHSISQIGYVVCGLALGTPLGIAGGLFHLMNHSVFKSLLFLNAGAVEYSTGTRELKKLGGLQQGMPQTSWTSLVASLSIAGVPPFCGFWSKLLIIIALFQKARFFYGGLAILVGVITLASFLKIQKYVFYRKVKEMIPGAKEAPILMCCAMIGLAILCLGLGLYYRPLLNRVLLPAADVLLQGREYFVRILGG